MGEGRLYTARDRECVDTDESKLPVKSVCEPAPKSLLWVPSCVSGFEYAPWFTS